MVLNENLEVCLCVYNVGAVTDGVSVLSDRLSDTVKDLAEFLEIELDKVDLRQVLAL